MAVPKSRNLFNAQSVMSYMTWFCY